MTKKDFIKLWATISKVVTKKVNGQLAINSYCELNDHCGGYFLVLQPKSLMWANEITFIIGAVQLVPASIEFDIDDGIIRIW